MTDQLSLCLDSPMLGRVKNDRTMMVFNFFSLSRERVDALPVFEDPSLGVRIEVRAKGTGVATIWDKQVLDLHRQPHVGQDRAWGASVTALQLYGA